MSEGERKPVPTIPKEAQVMVAILRDLGIQVNHETKYSYEPLALIDVLIYTVPTYLSLV